MSEWTGNRVGLQRKSWKGHFTQRGGAANYLCMTDVPQYSNYAPGVQSGNYVYGVEYQIEDCLYLAESA